MLRRIAASFALLGLMVAAPALAADKLPAGEAAAKDRVLKSPRHGEYVDIALAGGKPIRAYVVYPERKEKAPVVIVIHEIFGLSDWIKGVTDQLAADGFIAIAPDMLSGMGKDGKGTDGFADRGEVTKAVRELTPELVVKQLNAVRDYGKTIAASNGKTATIGFCWGGGKSFEYALANPELSAAVVYYGTNPKPEAIANLKVPVAGFYGGDDARVNATVGPAEEAAKKAGKTYEPHTYEGAGHGFLRQQDGREGKNQKAADQAWPDTIKFIKAHAEK